MQLLTLKLTLPVSPYPTSTENCFVFLLITVHNSFLSSFIYKFLPVLIVFRHGRVGLRTYYFTVRLLNSIFGPRYYCSPICRSPIYLYILRIRAVLKVFTARTFVMGVVLWLGVSFSFLMVCCHHRY